MGNSTKRRYRVAPIPLLACLVLACHGGRGEWAELDDATACEALRDLNAEIAGRGGHEASGRLRIDSAEFRVLGTFHIWGRYQDHFRLDVEHTSLMGAHRESSSIVVRGDTLEMVDWERGEYWRRNEALPYLRRVLGIELDPIDLLRVGLWRMPDCDDSTKMRRRGEEVEFSGSWLSGGYSILVKGADPPYPEFWRWGGPGRSFTMKLGNKTSTGRFWYPREVELRDVDEEVTVYLEVRDYAVKPVLEDGLFAF